MHVSGGLELDLVYGSLNFLSRLLFNWGQNQNLGNPGHSGI